MKNMHDFLSAHRAWLNEPEPEDLAEQLVTAALKAQGIDTIILVEIESDVAEGKTMK